MNIKWSSYWLGVALAFSGNTLVLLKSEGITLEGSCLAAGISFIVAITAKILEYAHD